MPRSVPIAHRRSSSSEVTPIVGAADDYDGLLDLVGDRRFVLIGEASHGTHEFYRERARITRRLIDELGFTAVAVEADWPDAYRVNRYVMGLSDDPDAEHRALATSAGSRRGCGATATSSSSSSGSGPATTRTGTRRPRPASTVSTSTACGRRWRRSSTTSIGSTRPRRDGPASATACFDHVGGGRAGLRLRARVRGRAPVRERGRRAAGRAPAPGRGVPAPRRLDRRGRAVLRRAERAGRARRRGVLPADVPRRGVVVEPPRPAHGRHARRACRAPRPAVRPREGRGLGAQLPRRRRARHRRWERAASSTSASSLGSATATQCLLDRPHHLHRRGHRAVGLGRRRRAQARAARARRRATRRCCTRRRRPSFWVSTHERPGAGRARGPAPRAGDRRDLPARDRAPEPLLRRADSPTSSTRSSTGSTRTRSSRSSGRRCGTAASRPRPTRAASEEGASDDDALLPRSSGRRPAAGGSAQLHCAASDRSCSGYPVAAFPSRTRSPRRSAHRST